MTEQRESAAARRTSSSKQNATWALAHTPTHVHAQHGVRTVRPRLLRVLHTHEAPPRPRERPRRSCARYGGDLVRVSRPCAALRLSMSSVCDPEADRDSDFDAEERGARSLRRREGVDDDEGRGDEDEQQQRACSRERRAALAVSAGAPQPHHHRGYSAARRPLPASAGPVVGLRPRQWRS